MKYFDEVTKAMKWLADKPNSIFIGQTVLYDGSVISKTLDGIPESKRLELPVMEEAQMGMSTGLSLKGYVPISIYPRIDFLLLACNQLSNHLDILKELTHGEWEAKVIIRTIVGAKEPLYPGLQHCRDHTEVFRTLLGNIHVQKLRQPEEIMVAYQRAWERKGSTLIAEMAERYGME